MRVITMVCALTFLWTACGASQAGGEGDPCKDFDLDVKKVWNAEVRLKVDLAIQQLGGEAGVGGSEEVVTRMDDVTRDWVMLRESACNDHFKRKLITAEEYKGKVACFDAFLERLRTMIAALESGDGAAVEGTSASPGELDLCK